MDSPANPSIVKQDEPDSSPVLQEEVEEEVTSPVALEPVLQASDKEPEQEELAPVDELIEAMGLGGEVITAHPVDGERGQLLAVLCSDVVESGLHLAVEGRQFIMRKLAASIRGFVGEVDVGARLDVCCDAT